MATRTGTVYLTQLLQAGFMSIFPSQLINHYRAVPSYPDTAITPAAGETAPNTERTAKMLRPINMAKVKLLRPKTIAFTTLRRLRVIVALGALLCVLGGVVTASPALAGRGHKWQFGPLTPFTLSASFCGFKVRVTPGAANKEYTKILKTADGSMTFLFTGAIKASFTNLQTGRTITENMSGPGKATIGADGSITEVHTGRNGPFILTPADAKRFGLPTVSVTAGALRFAVAANGVITSLSLHGHVLVNVCAALS